MTTLAERLQRARLDAGCTNASAFARDVGVTPNTIYRIEKGDIRPSIETLKAWATRCGRSTDALLDVEPTEAAE